MVALADNVIKGLESGSMREDKAKLWGHSKLKEGPEGIVFEFVH